MTVCLSPNGPMVHKGPPPERLFVATIDGVALLERSRPGTEWRLTGRLQPGLHVSALVYDPRRNHLFLSTHAHGIHRSLDGGRTWGEASQGLTRKNVFSLAAVEKDGRFVLLAGTEPVSLFVSHDRAASWEELPSVGQVPGHEKWTFPVPPHEAHLKAFALDRRDPDTFYACVEQGALLKTTDGGRSWRELASYYRDTDKWYRDVHKVVPLDSDPDTLLMSTGVGVYRSEDAGENWTQLTDLDFHIRYPDHLIVAPDDEQTIFLSGAGLSPDNWKHTHAAGATVRLSRDGGRSWEPADQGLGPTSRPAIEAMAIVEHDRGYTLFLGNTDGDVYEREKGAEGWTCIFRGLGPVSKVGHYKHVQPDAEHVGQGGRAAS